MIPKAKALQLIAIYSSQINLVSGYKFKFII